jgi:hypothetical protein
MIPIEEGGIFVPITFLQQVKDAGGVRSFHAEPLIYFLREVESNRETAIVSVYDVRRGEFTEPQTRIPVSRLANEMVHRGRIQPEQFSLFVEVNKKRDLVARSMGPNASADAVATRFMQDHVMPGGSMVNAARVWEKLGGAASKAGGKGLWGEEMTKLFFGES